MKIPEGNPAKPEGAEGAKMLDRMNGGDHEDLAEWGLSFVDFANAKEALDVGCGGGANLARILAHMPEGKVCGVDYAPLSVEKSKEFNAEAIAAGKIEVEQANVGALTFNNNSFDVVTAFETVYFWPDPHTAFNQIKRVLRPGGTLLVCNDADGSDSDHYVLAMSVPGMTMYTPSELEELVARSGFKDIKIYDDVLKGRVSLTATCPRHGQAL